MNTLYDRLAEICRDQGIEKPRNTDIAKVCDVSTGRAAQIKKEGPAAKLGNNTLTRLVGMGYNPDWINGDSKEKRIRSARPEAYDVIEGGDDVFSIHHMNGRAKGGMGGLAPSHEYVVGSISVTDSWLRRKLPAITRRENLRVIEAYGRSMEPTLESGDLLVVDTGVHDARIDGIYILLRKNTPEPEIMVKRLQRTLDGGLIVRSDNRAEYDPETIAARDLAEKVEIIGRVVWIWAGREG